MTLNLNREEAVAILKENFAVCTISPDSIVLIEPTANGIETKGFHLTINAPLTAIDKE